MQAFDHIRFDICWIRYRAVDAVRADDLAQLVALIGSVQAGGDQDEDVVRGFPCIMNFQ